MNFIHKFIIPLLDKKITLEDISEEVGFCGMATMDVNRPYYDNHIFLVYSMVMTNKAIAVRKKLASLDNLYSKIDCRIQGKPCRIFCFPIIGKTIINLMSNIIAPNDNELIQIYKFWNFNDSDINNYMVNNTYLPELFKESIVPEFDYSPKFEFDEKGQALIYQCPPFILLVLTRTIQIESFIILICFLNCFQICFLNQIFQKNLNYCSVLYPVQLTVLQQERLC